MTRKYRLPHSKGLGGPQSSHNTSFSRPKLTTSRLNLNWLTTRYATMTTAAASDGLEIWLGWNYYIQVNIFMTWSRKRQYFLKHFYGWCHLRYLRLLQFDNILRISKCFTAVTMLNPFQQANLPRGQASHRAHFSTMAPTIAQEWLKAPDKAWNGSGYHWFLQNEGYKLEVMRPERAIQLPTCNFRGPWGRLFERWGRRPFGLHTAQKVSSSPLTADSSNPTLQTCQYDPPCDSNRVKIKLISASATKKEYTHVYIPMKQL